MLGRKTPVLTMGSAGDVEEGDGKASGSVAGSDIKRDLKEDIRWYQEERQILRRTEG